MKQLSICLAAIASLHVFAPPAKADLPILKEKRWLGYFVVWEDRKSRFGINSEASGHLFALDRKGQVLRGTNPITIDFRVLETTPDGKMIRRSLEKDSLSSTQKAAVDPEKPVTLSGKVKGDVGFETTVTPMRGGFTVSGKLTDKRNLTNPTQFGVDLNFDPYRKIELITEEQQKQFERMSRRDELEVVTLKGEKVKFDIDEKVHLAEKFPEGVSHVTIESVRYEDMDIELIASEGSRILFDDDKVSPVYESLKIVWVMNAGADPAKEKLTVNAK